jgi:hypothetical protein
MRRSSIRPVAGLKQDLALTGRAVVDVLVVEAGEGGHKKIGVAIPVSDAADAAVSGAMTGKVCIIDGLVGHDRDADITALEDCVRFPGVGSLARFHPERSAWGHFSGER